MANLIQLNEGTPIVWGTAATYDGDGGAITHEMLFTSLADSAARQGVKADLGDPRPRQYAVTLRIEMDVAPDPNKYVYVYWAPSLSGIAATANPGGVSGADAAYTGTAGSTLAIALNRLTLIGVMYMLPDVAAVVQQETWMFTPPTRYGSPVIYNASGEALEDDALEQSLTFTPEDDEAQ